MSQTQQYDPGKVYGPGENIPRHGARSKNGKKRRRTKVDELNAQRVGTVGGLKRHGKKKGE